jgi:hypothetical protein
MTNGRQLWPGDEMRGFFRAHIRRETSLDAASTEKLAEALAKAVNRMLVWDVPAAVEAQPTAATVSSRGKIKPPVVAAPVPEAAKKDPGAFDPYAFSAIVVLSKTGKDGLLKRLADIKSVENLRSFAEAQHLAVDRTLKRADDLRKAIATATEQRLADRKAAAS